MNTEYLIPIPNDLSNYVESLVHEYNAIHDVLHYIRSQGNNLLIYLDEYEYNFEIKKQELEFAKDIVSKQYNPFPEGVPYFYEFHFDDYSIAYEERKD